jgi:uncharacterized repeat protein (TIGR02543 family)
MESRFLFWEEVDGNPTFIPPLLYTIIFNSMGGSAIEDKQIQDGHNLTPPTDPEKTGHDFGGWYTEMACTTAWIFSTAITENMELFAKWNPHSFTVKFYSEGDELTALELENVAYDSKILAPETPSNLDNTLKFAGWYTDGVNFAGSTSWDFTTNTVTENIELHALWISKSVFNVIFNTNGGTLVDNPTCYENDRVAERITTKDGYNFVGWYTDEQCTQLYNFSTPVTDDLVLWAKWSIIPTEPVTPTDPNTPTGDNSTTTDQSSKNTPMIIGGVVALIALLIGVIASIIIVCKVRKRESD